MEITTLNLALIILCGFLGGVLITFLVMKNISVPYKSFEKLREENAENSTKLSSYIAIEENNKAQLLEVNQKLKEEQELNKAQQNQIGKLSNQCENLQEKLDTQIKQFEEIRKQSLVQFENVASKLLEEKSTKFSRVNKENMEQILGPLRENIKDFKKKVEETYDKESKERHTLESKIKELADLNQKISKEAKDLTNALKGQVKTQGDWGEMILENILEYSGLQKGREYFPQESFKDSEGKKKRPDVMIKYPDNRYVIIDSKVSLTSYERYAASEEADEQKIHLKNHVKSIRSHVDNLSSKKYDDFDNALDFVMMFVPIEPAYMLAIQEDPQLWNYAYSKRILLISPTNLIAALKMVADIWKREYQNQNAMKIAKRGEMLYGKFASFIKDMEDIETHLGRLSKSYEKAVGKLHKGSGNLIGQAEKLKQLGVSTSKSLPEKYLIDNVELDD